MIIKEKRQNICAINEDAVLFDNPSFDNSIIGVTINGEVVYSLSKMLNELSNDDNISIDDAYEFIDYNTIRSLSYISMPYKPIIISDELE